MTSALREYWPQHGSVWAEWTDLQLAIQLATLRSGFSGSARVKNSHARFHFRCRHERKTGDPCTTSLMSAGLQDVTDLSSGWKVTSIGAGCADISLHKGHRQAMYRGLSEMLDDSPDPATLRPGDLITQNRHLHTLEACVRRYCRARGRFISTCFRTKIRNPSTDAFLCDQRAKGCEFVIRFELEEEGEDGEHRWRCVKLQSAHTCERTVGKAPKMLRKAMWFWPRITLVDGTYDRSAAVGNPRREARNDDEDEVEDPPIARGRAEAPSPFSSPQRKKKILPTPSPSIERSPSPAPSAASTSRSRSASPDRASSRAASPEPANPDSDAEDDQADAGADAAASPSANSSIWSSISHRASLLARAESRLPPLRTTVSRLESELEEARLKLQKQEGIVERRKGRMRREMRRALGAEKGVEKVRKGKKEKERKKRRKGKKRASPEL